MSPARAPLVVVTGTGTEIGKTHVAVALLLAWRQVLVARGLTGPRVAGLKPVESGVTPGAPTDAGTLEQASTFHVKRVSPPYMLTRAVSPHLAAAAEGRTIAVTEILRPIEDARASADAVLVELAGGLFTPLAPGLTNCDVARALGADAVLLVVPDRLGVLHDVAAATRAAKAEGLTLTGIIVVAPGAPDASTGTNAAELSVVTAIPVLATVPRATSEAIAQRDDVRAILSRLTAP